MKYFFIIIVLVLCVGCNKLEIDFQNNHKPVFYVYLEPNEPVYAYVSQSINTENVEFPTPDTLQTIVEMLTNNITTEELYPIQYDYDTVNIEERKPFMFGPSPNYKSQTIASSDKQYVFKLNYEDFPKIELPAYIPESVSIDSFNITPNIAYSHGDYFIQHNLYIRFKPPGRNGHFCVNVFYDYTDTTGWNEDRSIRDGFGIANFYQDNEILTNGEYYSLNYTMLSERHSGDFVPVIYLINISDDSYNYVMQEMAFIEYRENAGLFNLMPAHTPYSMIPNAYANVFAYSIAKKTGDVIQVTEPIITDYKIVENK